MVPEPLFRVANLVKTYEDTLALNGVSLDVFPGELLGVVGPNGSGKSTLTGILSGRVKADSGQMWLRGKPVLFKSSVAAMFCGIRSLPQFPEIYPHLNVLENVFIGQEIVREWPLLRLMNWKVMKERCDALLQDVGATKVDPYSPITSLSGGQQKAVALAHLLAAESRLLIFDEPAAALGFKQKLRLLTIMKKQAEMGRTVLFVSHDLEDVVDVCSRAIVMSKGEIIADLSKEALSAETLTGYLEKVSQ